MKNKKLKQKQNLKQKQKQKQTVIVNIDNSKKVTRRKSSKRTSQPKQTQPTIIPQPIYIPQYNYQQPPFFQQSQPERKAFNTEPEKPSGFQPNPVNDIILDPINPIPDVNEVRERRNAFFSTPPPEQPTQTDSLIQTEQPSQPNAFIQEQQPPKSKFSVPLAPSRRINIEDAFPPLLPDSVMSDDDSIPQIIDDIQNLVNPPEQPKRKSNKKSRSAKDRSPENLCQAINKKNGKPCSFMKFGNTMYCKRHQPKIKLTIDDDDI